MDRDFVRAPRDRALAQVRGQVVVVALEALARDAQRGREGVELVEALVADHVAPVLDRPADVRVLAKLVDQDRHAGRHGGARVRLARVDAFLAVASKREVRRYADTPIPPETERRILEAGRGTGSSKNRQPWRFVVLADRETVERAAEAVWAADNVLGAALMIAVIVRGKGPVSFDAGRAAQNMMLAAWNEGVGSCPNGIADAAAMGEALRLTEEDHFAVVLSFGYPAGDIDPEARTPEEWIARADRKALDEVVERR